MHHLFSGTKIIHDSVFKHCDKVGHTLWHSQKYLCPSKGYKVEVKSTSRGWNLKKKGKAIPPHFSEMLSRSSRCTNPALYLAAPAVFFGPASAVQVVPGRERPMRAGNTRQLSRRSSRRFGCSQTENLGDTRFADLDSLRTSLSKTRFRLLLSKNRFFTNHNDISLARTIHYIYS